jgi:hypothetical protein
MFCGPGWHGWSGGWHGSFGLPLGLFVLGIVACVLWAAWRRPRALAIGAGTCPRCSRTVDVLWLFCPVCGHDLGAGGPGKSTRTASSEASN